MTSHTVPQIILQQLGGNRFCAMTGAKNMVGGTDMLMFSLPARFAKDGINKVRITLTPSDTYRVEFMKIIGTKPVKVISEYDDVYADSLRRVFTSATGLDTHL
jgi:SH3-like domain-containing protein